MVGDTVMLGVREGVTVALGEGVIVAVEVGKAAPGKHACIKSASKNKTYSLRIENLIHAIANRYYIIL